MECQFVLHSSQKTRNPRPYDAIYAFVELSLCNNPPDITYERLARPYLDYDSICASVRSFVG